ncbi:MAG: branched-chain amino acid ABC transporter permease, partial [Actinobacteria bacterium]|nr:branched-chain amino acid ABC transporter permease [Actinomycetota bacterium]
AYTAAWFASLHFSQTSFHLGSVGLSQDAVGIHLSVWLILLIAGALTALAGILIGLPTLRLRGDYLAIVTLGFGEIIPQFVRNGDSFSGFNLTNGSFGISPIDSPGFGKVGESLGLPLSFQQSFDRQRWFFWVAIVLLLVTVFCSVRLRDSRLGRAWIAIREDETAAAAMGIPLMRTKTWAYAIGAFFGGVAGAYYATFKSGAFPSDFYFNFSVFLLCMVILGGMGSVWGVVVGGLFLAYLDQEGLAKLGNWISETVSKPLFDEAIDVPKYNFGVYGLIIVLMMLFRPTGLIPERRRKKELAEGVHDETLYDESA